MFRKSKTETQLDLQSSVCQYIEGTAYKQFSDKTAWHNQFYEQITSKIDENFFSCLFTEKTGAPNASIRQLIAMMLLKEGHGWSDSELFDGCRFNLLIRKALGLINLDETIPSESTYYLLRKHIVEHEKATGQNLFAAVFEQLTKSQIAEFIVSGKSIRMDSKLIGSNIAFFSRYEIIHSALCLYVKNCKPLFLNLLSEDEQKQIIEITEEESSKTVYRSTKEEVKERMKKLGILIYKLLNINSGNTHETFQTLKRIFEQQYKVQQEEIELRPKEEISAQSIQSPYDTECHFRKKNDEQTKGYSHNITETCNDSGLNLITDIQTKPASEADNNFVIPAIKNTNPLLTDKIENLHTDGAYHSTVNQEYTKENNIQFYPTGMQGAESRYDLTLIENELQVIDRQTGETLIVTPTSNNKFRINTEKGYRYFGQKEIEKSLIRKQIGQFPADIKNKRNNVEASIYQLSYHLRKDNTRYRGLIKNTIWASLRCLWINFARIVKYVTISCQRTNNNVKYLILNNFLILSIFYFLTSTRLELNGFYKHTKL